MLNRIILFLIVFFVSSTTVCASEKINKIIVTNNDRIESSTIESYSKMKIGDTYSSELKNNAIRNLYNTELFEDINISFGNGIVTISVQETPFVSKVVFIGNRKVKSSMLAAEIYTIAGDSLRRSRLKTDIAKIKEIYKRTGRFAVQVEAKVESQENNRVKIIFNVTEGPKVGIRKIYFAGNNNYRDSELKSIILTKESRWFRFLETNDTYDPDRIEYDKYLLTNFYHSVGFADFKIISVTADLEPTREGFAVTYSVEEGEKYVFGSATIDNKLEHIETNKLSRLINIKPGKMFNINVINNIAEKMTDRLASQGYPHVAVTPDLVPNPANKSVDVKFIIDEADRIFVGKIGIEGNMKTEDHVIRRQFKIQEGDLFNRSKIDRGEQNMRNLDYFEKVFVKISPTDTPDKYDVNVNVQEKSTTSLGFDVGYNTAGGPFGRISFLEKNLVGTGQYLSAGVQIGKKNTNYYAGITNPYFMGRDLSLGHNVFYSINGRKSGFAGGEHNYSSKSIGLRNSLGYDITEDLSHEIEYTIKQSDLKSAKESSSIFIKEQMGKFTTSSLGQTLTYDRTDSRVVPKNGYIFSASQEFAGLGGDTKYLKHEADAKFFKSFMENKYTLKLALSAGIINGVGGKKVRISDRYNLGDSSLRGFDNAGIGPRTKLTDEGLGGQKYYTISTELHFPTPVPEEFNFRGFVFVDAGALWDADSKTGEQGFHNDKSLRVSVGPGFIWNTRIAPINVAWGWAIKKKKYDDTERFHIKFATHF